MAAPFVTLYLSLTMLPAASQSSPLTTNLRGQIVWAGSKMLDTYKKSLEEKPKVKSLVPQVEEKSEASISEYTTLSTGKDLGTLDQTKWEQAMSNVSVPVDQDRSQEQESEKEQA